MNRIFIVIACCTAFLFPGVSGKSHAATIHMERVNPMYRSLWEKQKAGPRTRRNISAARACRSIDEVREAIRYSLEHRETDFSFEMVYDFAFGDLADILDQAFNDVIWADDYLAYNFSGYSIGWFGNNGDATVTYDPVVYLTTYEQEQTVDQRVAEILPLIVDDKMTDLEKEKAIHDWIVSNVAYDTDQNNPEYSAWAALALGKTVCQGYSLLNFKMLKAAGVTSRIIVSDNAGHAWNMTRVCGHWYHEDLTWDDPVPDVPGGVVYDYFNLSDDEISGKDPGRTDWRTSTLPAPPRAPDSYVPGICIVAGDFDGNNMLDLSDIVIGLQVCAGLAPAGINMDADPDGLIGLTDTVYIIQAVAGLR